MGRAAAKHCERLGLPPVTRVVTSPFIRTAETAANAAKALGVSSIGVEPGLAETICEEWYRSWGVPGADSTWGGPKDGSYPMGSQMSVADLHQGCICPVRDIHAGGELLREAIKVTTVSVDDDYIPVYAGFDYQWDAFESHEETVDRMVGTVEALAKRHPSESVLCLSHGGPCTELSKALHSALGCTPRRSPRAQMCQPVGLRPSMSMFPSPLMAESAAAGTCL